MEINNENELKRAKFETMNMLTIVDVCIHYNSMQVTISKLRCGHLMKGLVTAYTASVVRYFSFLPVEGKEYGFVVLDMIVCMYVWELCVFTS